MRGIQPLKRLLLIICLSIAGRGHAQDKDKPSPAEKSDTATDTKANGNTSANDTNRKKTPRKSTDTQSIGSASSSKGVIKGIVDGKIRFDCKEFPDIAVGQIYVVEGKTQGQLAARIEVIQVSKSKKIAAAKMAKLEADFQISDLLNSTVYREKDFNARYGDTNVSSLVAPDAIAGRNNLFGFFFHVVNDTPPAANLITGVSLNQSVTSVGTGLEVFLPQDKVGTVPNRIGLGLNYLQSIPVTIVGRVNGTDETQTLKVTSSHWKFSLIYKSRTAGGSLSEYWASAGYEILDTKAKLDTNVGAGNTNIEFSQKGPEFAAGGDFSPLPFLYMGADLFAGIPQKYSGTDTSNEAARSGSWNQFRTGVYSELRYPVGRARNNVLSIRVKGGISSERVDVQKNGATSKESFISPFFALRAGFSSG